MKRALAAASLAAAFALPALPVAEAQCSDDSIVCAEVEVSGSVQFGRRRNVVVVQPAPQPPAQVVVTQAPPPPPVFVTQPPQPQGRVIVVQPAPQAPPPQHVVVTQTQQPMQETVVVIEQHPARYRLVAPFQNRKVGMTARIGSMISEDVRMGGIQAGLRFRPSRIFGIEVGVGVYGGNDFNGMSRAEVPLTFDMMFFLPRASRVQAYVLGGFGISYAHTTGFHQGYGRDMERDMAYFGGQMGMGLEWRIAPRFALSTDIRAFIRTRISEDIGDLPEFYDPANGRSTDTSVGAIGTLGAHFYF